LGVLSGICMAAAGVLAVTALLSPPPRLSAPSGGQAPQVEFFWSIPDQHKPNLRPQVADSASELQTEITPVRHHRRHRDIPSEHGRPKRHHHHGELAPISTSEVTEFSAPPAPSSKVKPSDEVAAVEERLRRSLSEELFNHFELFLYVSKAVSGPLAQHMYVFQKNTYRDISLLYDWPVSTGRDRTEKNVEGVMLSSFTPAGYFKLDPNRFYRHHTSSEWRQPMPFAMFFDWVERGMPTGLAIHAATGNDIAALGRRASAGCIRLAPKAAETLFTLIRSRYRGLTPRFAVDHRTGTMRNDGIILHDANGRAELTEGYKVLVVVENYGGANLIAAMY
jgi:L,D-transpeptidase-like protein